MRWARHVARIRQKRNTCRVMFGKFERKKKERNCVEALGLTGGGCIKMHFKGIRLKGVDSIKLAKNGDK
jgi:hypothetical protein